MWDGGGGRGRGGGDGADGGGEWWDNFGEFDAAVCRHVVLDDEPVGSFLSSVVLGVFLIAERDFGSTKSVLVFKNLDCAIETCISKAVHGFVGVFQRLVSYGVGLAVFWKSLGCR